MDAETRRLYLLIVRLAELDATDRTAELGILLRTHAADAWQKLRGDATCNLKALRDYEHVGEYLLALRIGRDGSE